MSLIYGTYSWKHRNSLDDLCNTYFIFIIKLVNTETYFNIISLIMFSPNPEFNYLICALL